MHKKDRPMLSVTALLYGTTSPNSPSNSNSNQLNSLFQQQNSPTSSINSASNGMTITASTNNSNGNGTAQNNSAAGHGINFSNNNGGGNNGIHLGNGNGTNLDLSLTNIINNSNNMMLIGNNGNSLSPTGNNLVQINNNNNNSNNSVCDNTRYPPNHPLSGSKHLCAICEDRASGKHYGVYSCEGCKGFFKRTVRKDLTYVCRDEKRCIVDKRQRNRCQYCRYQKCLEMGMKREAVQEERQRNKPENEVESSGMSITTTNSNVSPISNNSQFLDLTIERIIEAEQQIELKHHDISNTKIASKEIELLFQWLKMIPYFTSLNFDDQLVLLKTGWNELLIAEFSYRSTSKRDALVLANGMVVSRQNAVSSGIGDIFDRVLNELVSKMRQMDMDRTELGCLRAIVLLNPAIKSLKYASLVEKLRDRIYSILENHCRLRYPNKTSRFAKLLVRLPALRSIGLKCVEHLFFDTFLAETNQKNETIDNFCIQMLKKLQIDRYD